MKEKILEIAEKNFFGKRYSDVKLDIIARELGIKKPSIYHHFKDKKDLAAQTLKFSMKKYIISIKKIISENNLENFIIWYLTYPSANKNLFGIAFQKEFCSDEDLYYIISKGKNMVFGLIEDFFSNYNITRQRFYLIINLLEKLTQNNCIGSYCLKFDEKELAKEISGLIKARSN